MAMETKSQKITSTNMNEHLNLAEDIHQKICAFLANKINTLLTKDQLIALISPWCRSFTHTTLHYYLNNLPADSHTFNPENAPGDTLAYMRWHKTDDYLEYLSGSHSPSKIWPQIQKESELLVMPRFLWAKTIVFQAGIPKNFLRILVFSSFFRIRKLSYKKKIKSFKINTEVRSQLCSELTECLKEYQFGAWLSKKTLEMLPRIFLEGINNACLNYKKNQSFNAIFSSDCWSSIDSLKIMSFTQKNMRNVMLIGTPHAFNYSALHHFWLAAYELSFLDRYLGWGFLRNNLNKKITPFFINKFAGYQRARSPNLIDENKSVLLTGAMRPNHLVEYPFEPTEFKKYLLEEIQIARITSEITSNSVKIRTRNKDRGGSFESLFNENSPPNVSLDFQSGSFIDEIINYSLHVCDNTSTTVIESLIINHPTIVVIANKYFSISPTAIASFENLKKVGVFHTSIDSYAAHLKKIHGQINQWWQNHETQRAVTEFLNEHARTGGSITMWKKILLN
jgi:putative transferase (TIGR04331 family)